MAPRSKKEKQLSSEEAWNEAERKRQTMKCFTDNPLIHWTNKHQLHQLIEQFWGDDEIPKNKPALMYWLNMHSYSWEVYKKDLEYAPLLERAEQRLEGELIHHGLTNDKTFARYMLEQHHGYNKKDNSEVKEPIHIEVTIES